MAIICQGNQLAVEGHQRLAELVRCAEITGISNDHLSIDVSIARGLDYYTGTVYETFLHDLPQIGSVCSGGRYDNLAETFTKQKLPGVGASLGLDRLGEELAQGRDQVELLLTMGASRWEAARGPIRAAVRTNASSCGDLM